MIDSVPAMIVLSISYDPGGSCLGGFFLDFGDVSGLMADGPLTKVLEPFNRGENKAETKSDRPP